MYLYTHIYTFTYMCIQGIFTYTLYIYTYLYAILHIYSYIPQLSLIQTPMSNAYTATPLYPYTYPIPFTNQPGTCTFISPRQPNSTYQNIYRCPITMHLPFTHL